MHAQREHAAYLRHRGGHYLLTVKGNQPGLHDQLKALPWKNVPIVHRQSDRGHDRVEQRSLKIVSVPAGIAFPDAAQAIQITRRTHRKPSKSRRHGRALAVISVHVLQHL